MPDSAVEIQFALRSVHRTRQDTRDPEAPVSVDGRLPRVTQVLALAVYFQELIARGEARDYADLARLCGLTRERLSQIMELLWLAPDIQKEVLEFAHAGVGRFPISEVATRKIAEHLAWADQRRDWEAIKNDLHL